MDPRNFNATAVESPLTELGVLAHNLSNQRWAEAAAGWTNPALLALVDAIPLPMVAIDSEENVTKWNSAAEQMFGWSETEVLGRPLPFDAAGRSAFREALRGRAQVAEESVRQTRSGGAIDTGISAAPIVGPDGGAIGVVAVFTDLTDRKRLEAQLQQAQKMDAVGRLAGGIAHDFNNLLTVVTGYGELLDNSLPTDSRTKRYAQEILQSAEKASALTKQLLSFSRPTSPRPTLLLQVGPVVDKMSGMLGRLIGEDIKLTMALDPAAVAVRAEPGQIEQILINLVLNARDAMPRGGRIEIATSIEELAAPPGRHVCLAVSDDGTGMTEATRSRLFEPFFTTKEVGKGTGLGLSTVFAIVKQNGGEIQVESEMGKGSTFKVYLPAVESLLEPAKGDAKRALSIGCETILLVEDEAGLRRMTKELLEGLGYTVLAAESGASAVHIASLHPGRIHLVLTDVVMPMASGQELSGWLRRFGHRAPVLYMSGYPAETVSRHGVGEDRTSFLEKPFTPEGLANKVREALDAPVTD